MNSTEPDVRNAVIAAIARATSLAVEEIQESVEWSSLGLDSLDLSAILIDVEDQIGRDVPVEVLDRLGEAHDIFTVGDILRLLDGWMSQVTHPFPVVSVAELRSDGPE